MSWITSDESQNENVSQWDTNLQGYIVVRDDNMCIQWCQREDGTVVVCGEKQSQNCATNTFLDDYNDAWSGVGLLYARTMTWRCGDGFGEKEVRCGGSQRVFWTAGGAGEGCVGS